MMLLPGYAWDEPAGGLYQLALVVTTNQIVARRPALGRLFRAVTYTLESTPLRVFGLSHFLVLEKSED